LKFSWPETSPLLDMPLSRRLCASITCSPFLRISLGTLNREPKGRRRFVMETMRDRVARSRSVQKKSDDDNSANVVENLPTSRIRPLAASIPSRGRREGIYREDTVRLSHRGRCRQGVGGDNLSAWAFFTFCIRRAGGAISAGRIFLRAGARARARARPRERLIEPRALSGAFRTPGGRGLMSTCSVFGGQSSRSPQARATICVPSLSACVAISLFLSLTLSTAAAARRSKANSLLRRIPYPPCGR